jgi:hypothetical protein
MLSTKFVAETLSGVSRRVRNRSRVRRRQRPGNHLSPAAAEVLLLEPRCLMSGNVVAGGHHGPELTGEQNGDPVIIKFDGYEWNTNYNWSKDSGPYINNQLWSPDNVVLSGDDLQLYLRNAEINGQSMFASADAEIVGKADGQKFNPGYGTYMVSAKTAGGESFSQFTNNQYAIFGQFTYENLHDTGGTSPGSDEITGLPTSLLDELKRRGATNFYVTANAQNSSGVDGQPVFPVYPNTTFVKDIRGDTVVLTNAANSDSVAGQHTIYFTDNSLKNRNREIDELEVSQFGGLASPNNAQFVLQPSQASQGGSPNNVKGFQLPPSASALTTVMVWKGPHTPVVFKLYEGNFSSIKDAEKTTPFLEYKTPDDQNIYVPNSEQQTFHLNLWQFNYNGSQPAPSATSVIVTKFQYDPIV